MLLLCDLVDRGDLEAAMGKDYRGELYSEEGAKTWPLPSVTLQILLGFFHMHVRGILHQVCAELLLLCSSLTLVAVQDFKPANLMLHSDGMVKITDFGLSKEKITDNRSAKSMCGTPEYLAPEILDRRGHGKAVDWY